jgi:beta-lactamase class A
MIITSDNTATDLVIGKVGGIGSLNAMSTRAGYDPLHLTMTTGELFAKYATLQAPDRDDKTINDPAYWLGSMTPRATVRMLEDIQRCNDGAAPVGHKTGDFAPALANDVGIIYARSGPIVVAFFLNRIRGPYASAAGRADGRRTGRACRPSASPRTHPAARDCDGVHRARRRWVRSSWKCSLDFSR